jgi:hypothetical protein
MEKKGCTGERGPEVIQWLEMEKTVMTVNKVVKVKRVSRVTLWRKRDRLKMW